MARVAGPQAPRAEAAWMPWFLRRAADTDQVHGGPLPGRAGDGQPDVLSNLVRSGLGDTDGRDGAPSARRPEGGTDGTAGDHREALVVAA